MNNPKQDDDPSSFGDPVWCGAVSGVVAALIGILAAGRGDAAIKLICTRWRCRRQPGWRGCYRLVTSTPATPCTAGHRAVLYG